MSAGRDELYKVITKSPKRKWNGKNNNRKMIKHKRNKKMPGIYSLHLKRGRCSTFRVKQKQRQFLDGDGRGSWGWPVSGADAQSRKGETQQLAGILTTSRSSCSSVTESDTKWMVQCGLTDMTCHHVSGRRTQSHRHWVWESRAGRPRRRAGEVCLCKVGGGSRALRPGSFCTNESSNSPREREMKSQFMLSRTLVGILKKKSHKQLC